MCIYTYAFVLTLAGVERLCRSSRFPRTQEVLAWFNHKVSVILAEGALFMQQQGIETSQHDQSRQMQMTHPNNFQMQQRQNTHMQFMTNPGLQQQQNNMAHPQLFPSNSLQQPPDTQQVLTQLRLDIQQAVRMQLSTLQHEIDVRVQSQVEQQMAAAQLHLMSDNEEKKTEINPSLYMELLKQQQQQLQNQNALIQMQQMKMHAHSKEHIEFQAQIQLHQATIDKHSAFLQRTSNLLENCVSSKLSNMKEEDEAMDTEPDHHPSPKPVRKRAASPKDSLHKQLSDRLKVINRNGEVDPGLVQQIVIELQNKSISSANLASVPDADLNLLQLAATMKDPTQIAKAMAMSHQALNINSNKKVRMSDMDMDEDGPRDEMPLSNRAIF